MYTAFSAFIHTTCLLVGSHINYMLNKNSDLRLSLLRTNYLIGQMDDLHFLETG